MEDDVTPVEDSVQETTDDDVVDELLDETEETSEESEESESDGEELEEETETPDEEPEEDSTEEEVGRVSFKTLKEKLGKDVFTKVPELRHIIGREQEYTNLYPTIEDAKIAKESVGALQYFEEIVGNGVIAPILEGLQKTKGPEAYKGFVNNFLPTLKKTDRDTYLETTEPVIVEALGAALQSMEATGNQIGAKSVRNVLQIIFGKPELPKTRLPEAKLDLEAPDEKVTQREQELLTQRYMDFRDDATEAATNRLRALIRREVDPENKLQGTYREFLTDRMMSEINTVLSKDPQYQVRFKKILKAVQSGDMSYTRKKEIVESFVRRAKEVFGPIKRKVLSQSQGQKTDKLKPFRANSETTSRPKNAPKPGQPKLGGTVKDDVDFLLKG